MDSQLLYLHADHLYTPQVATGYSGVTQHVETIVWRMNAMAYGLAWNSSDPDGDGQSAYVALRFPSQIACGLQEYNYNYYRDYDPCSGRYLESDPIGLMGGGNSYAYLGGNPLSVIDPLGSAGCSGPDRNVSFPVKATALQWIFQRPGMVAQSFGLSGRWSS